MPILPPWITAADPAGQAATGLQLGSRIGAEQAAQAYQQQQMLMQQQQQAAQQQRWQQELALEQAAQQREAEKVARIYAAQKEYEQRVGAGEDATKVILSLGPRMGLGASAEAAAIRAEQQAQMNWKPDQATLPEGFQYMQSGPGRWQIHQVKLPKQFEDVKDEKGNLIGQREIDTGQYHPFSPGSAGRMSEAQTDAAINRRNSQLDKLKANALTVGLRETDLETDRPDPKWNPGQVSYWSRVKKLEAEIAVLEGRTEEGAKADEPASNVPRGTNAPQTFDFVRDPKSGQLVPRQRLGPQAGAVPPQIGDNLLLLAQAGASS